MISKRHFLSVLVSASLLAITSSAYAAAQTPEMKIIRVGVVGEYNDQWETVNELLKPEGIQVELVKYSDYATPNRALADGEIDLNAFQHKAFLANDIKRNGYKIVAIGDTMMTPLRIYHNKEKIKSLSDIKDGDTIAIPSDLTNGGRAIKLLESAGLVTVDPAAGFVPTKLDITNYKVKITIREAESGILARLLPDFTAAVINGGNAYTAGLDGQTDAIFAENLDPKTNPQVADLVNVIVARESDKENPAYLKVVKAYQTPQTAKTIMTAYKGAFIPAWNGAEKYTY